MLADVYKDDTERGRAMGISCTGLALGLIGTYTHSFQVHTIKKELLGIVV